ncbi:MAG: 23S rRNA (uracil(1939)-C(5))-methyltransferase RlmD [Acaryochloridaceae cyanobacterium SU_2_1]|nr:23S rRNA (uracil(1939)-C(5))-methyltransferase RlmD [Acaryochloridaceae cyanobacterium SU_2_1]
MISDANSSEDLDNLGSRSASLEEQEPKHQGPVWQQGQLVELEITDLSPKGDGVGRWGEGQRVVFVPNTVTGDRILARLVWVKPRFAHGQIHQLLQASTHRVRPACIVADKCGGCQWQAVDYAYQLQAKHDQVVQALERIGGFMSPIVDLPLAAPKTLGYRNKVTYPMGFNPTLAKVQAGYYRKGSHQLINLNQCPVQDSAFDPLLANLKQDIQARGWTIYTEQSHQGQVRHLSLRIGRRTGEILITLVVCEGNLPDLDLQAQTWLAEYPGLVGVCLNVNPHRTNRIFGAETICVAGRDYLREEFAGLQFHLRPDTFFQIYTEQAERLVAVIIDQLQLTGKEQVVDLYCGVGTLTLPLAKRVASIVGIEVQEAALQLAQTNAALNQITNTQFALGTAKDCLAQLKFAPDLVVLDPPRKGCHEVVIAQLLMLKPRQIVYISCHPATLARDLARLCATGRYQLRRVQPADFFAQTAHVESVAFFRLY